MEQYWSDVLVASGIFAGAAVSSFCGFAFSALAGALLLHVLPATKAVPLMMVCSIAIQSVSLIVLRKTMNWKGSLIFIGGGILGIPPAGSAHQTAPVLFMLVKASSVAASYRPRAYSLDARYLIEN